MKKPAEQLSEKLQSWKLPVVENDEMEDDEDEAISKLIEKITKKIENKPIAEQARLWKILFTGAKNTAVNLPQGERQLRMTLRGFWKEGFKKD